MKIGFPDSLKTPQRKALLKKILHQYNTRRASIANTRRTPIEFSIASEVLHLEEQGTGSARRQTLPVVSAHDEADIPK